MSTQAEQNFQAFGNAGARPIWYHGKCARLSVEGLLKVRPAPHLPCALGHVFLSPGFFGFERQFER